MSSLAHRPVLFNDALAAAYDRPMPEQAGARAMWVAALINPLPPLGVAPEIRCRMLPSALDCCLVASQLSGIRSQYGHGDCRYELLQARHVEERLLIVHRGLQTSCAHMKRISNSFARRYLSAVPYFLKPRFSFATFRCFFASGCIRLPVGLNLWLHC